MEIANFKKPTNKSKQFCILVLPVYIQLLLVLVKQDLIKKIQGGKAM